MSDEEKREKTKPAPGEAQSDATAETNKPDDARAKGNPQAGNILAGVQSDTSDDG